MLLVSLPAYNTGSLSFMEENWSDFLRESIIGSIYLQKMFKISSAWIRTHSRRENCSLNFLSIDHCLQNFTSTTGKFNIDKNIKKKT